MYTRNCVKLLITHEHSLDVQDQQWGMRVGVAWSKHQHLIVDVLVALGGSDLVVEDDLVNICYHGIHRILIELGDLEFAEFLLDVSLSPTEHESHHAIRKRSVKS